MVVVGPFFQRTDSRNATCRSPGAPKPSKNGPWRSNAYAGFHQVLWPRRRRTAVINYGPKTDAGRNANHDPVAVK
eukprot:10693779-Alexandrium_andersonii.AAC.1